MAWGSSSLSCVRVKWRSDLLPTPETDPRAVVLVRRKVAAGCLMTLGAVLELKESWKLR